MSVKLTYDVHKRRVYILKILIKKNPNLYVSILFTSAPRFNIFQNTSYTKAEHDQSNKPCIVKFDMILHLKAAKLKREII